MTLLLCFSIILLCIVFILGSKIFALQERHQKLAREKDKALDVLNQELSWQEEKLHTVLQSMNEGIVILGDADRILFFNQQFLDLFGIQLNHSGVKFLDANRNSEIRKLLFHTRHGQVKKILDFCIQDRDLIFEVKALPIQFKGRPSRAILLRDLTAPVQSERSKREFIANASHQLKTPIAVIQSYVETMLRDSSIDGEQREKFLSKIYERSKDMTEMIVRLVELSKIEAGQKPMDSSRINLSLFMEQKLKSFEVLFAQKNIRLESNLAKDVFLETSAALLEMILDNLIENSVKFMPEGGSISCNLRDDQHRVLIECKDSGIGIPSEDLHHIFERFFKSRHAEKWNKGGTGIGLAMVKTAVDQMGGSIEVQSQLGKGTQFALRFEKAKAS